MMRRLSALTAAGVLALALAGCGGDDTDSATDTGSTDTGATGEQVSCDYPDDGTGGSSDTPVETPAESASAEGEVAATVTTNNGDIPIVLNAADAPCTVNSFTSLAEQGYFDATPCHRLTSSSSLSVLQCGDPTGTGTGGPGYSFDDELDALPEPDDRGVIDYPAGTLAMANAGPNTNGSQFFMVYEDSLLPPSYTIFGSIDDAGLEVLRTIAEAGDSTGMGDGAPVTETTIESVTLD